MVGALRAALAASCLVLSPLSAGDKDAVERPARSMNPVAQAQLHAGLTALYDLEYERSRSEFRKLIDLQPENPYGYLFDAGSIWWQSSNEYGLFKDTPALEGVFERDVQAAIDKADAALRGSDDPKERAQAHFAAGMALGTRGQWNLLRKRWIKAYFDGKKGIKHLNKCLKLDPEFHDAYLGLGVYDYQADRLPGILKLSALLLVRGDARRGIERMRLALEKGRYARSQAAQFLLALHSIDERDDARALEMIRRLRNFYPGSPYYQFLEAATLYRLNDFEGSLREAKDLFARVPEDPAILGRKQLSLWCGLYGEACLSPQGISAAIEWFSRALDSEPAKPSPWTTLLRFYRGVAHDMLGQRSLAIDEYERVLARAAAAPGRPRENGRPENGARFISALGMEERARRCLEAACTKEEVLLQLKALALGAEAVHVRGTSHAPGRSTGKASEPPGR